MISKTQIDKLGDRLRQGNLNEEDLRALDNYRRSFSDAYDFIVNSIREELQLEPTGRPAKSTTAIVEKLLRESIRLSQVQDIAGCRLIVSDMKKQVQIVHSLQQLFPEAIIVDRLKNPSHGYRAVHVIVRRKSRVVETQVRTSLQHLWAECSEKVADVFDPLIKYGGGDPEIVGLHLKLSDVIAHTEVQELQMFLADKVLSDVSTQHVTMSNSKRGELDGFRKELSDWQEKLDSYKQTVQNALQELLHALDAYRG